MLTSHTMVAAQESREQVEEGGQHFNGCFRFVGNSDPTKLTSYIKLI